MKKLSLLFLSLLLLCVQTSFAKGLAKKEVLFNGHDLSNWTLVVKEGGAAQAAKTFAANDGVISISGKPFGYMRTNKKYSDYVLCLEYRWSGGKAYDGGIYNRLQGKDEVWPANAVQCQLEPSQLGMLMGGVALTGVDPVEGFYRKGALKTGIENPVGEWNKVVILCKGDLIEVRINGQLVNSVRCSSTKGYIGFQSEGGPIEIRDVYIMKE